jgi:hypothetical protein
MTNKTNVMHWGKKLYFLEQVTKNSIQKLFACKSLFEEKGFTILLQNNHFGS